jgi:hypothetical protein
MVQDFPSTPSWLKGDPRVSENKKLQKGYKAAEGVSCDGCHGPASGWLEGHLPEHWAPKEWLSHGGAKAPAAASEEMWEKRGLFYSKDLVLWARQCARCHLSIESDLIEAEHPPLRNFELYDQNKGVPPHWRDYTKAKDTPELPGAGPMHFARMWQVGQVIALEAALRQTLGYLKDKRGMKHLLGSVQRAGSHHMVLSHALNTYDATKAKAAPLAAAMTQLAKAKKKSACAKAANKALKILVGLDYALSGTKVTKEMVKAIHDGIAADKRASKSKYHKAQKKLSLVPLKKTLG